MSTGSSEKLKKNPLKHWKHYDLLNTAHLIPSKFHNAALLCLDFFPKFQTKNKYFNGNIFSPNQIIGLQLWLLISKKFIRAFNCKLITLFRKRYASIPTKKSLPRSYRYDSSLLLLFRRCKKHFVKPKKKMSF